MRETVAVVGLGNIGGAIAARCVRVGHRVIGVEADVRRARAWSEMTGALVVARTADVMRELPDRVLVVVRTGEQALQVAREVTESAGPELALHLMTTLDPVTAGAIAEAVGAAVRVLEQPVSGGAAAAVEGTLTVLSAGPSRPVDEAFLLGAVAARVFHFERYGQPALVKLMNNAVAAANLRVTARMLGQAGDLGVDPVQLQAVLATSSGASYMGRMVAGLADDQASLLVKDVALLAGHGAALEPIDIGDTDGLLADLDRARRLLAD